MRKQSASIPGRMAVIHVRGVPDATHERLKAQAAAEGISLNRLLVRELARIAPALAPAEWATRARTGADPGRLEGIDAAGVVRDARDRRLAAERS